MSTENLPSVKSTKSMAPIKEDNQEFSLIEQVVMQGDLSKLDASQRVLYYKKVCESAGLNPFTRPFDYIQLNGKLTLYAKKDATEQLRKLNGISIDKLESKVVDDLYIVKATARTKDGRTDESTGVVTLGTLKGDARANAIMKAETKAKRRVTLSICGMGWTDETEIETIPYAEKINVDLNTGEIQLDSPKTVPLLSVDKKQVVSDISSNTIDIVPQSSLSPEKIQELTDMYLKTEDQFKKNYNSYIQKEWLKSIEEFHTFNDAQFAKSIAWMRANINAQSQGVI